MKNAPAVMGHFKRIVLTVALSTLTTLINAQTTGNNVLHIINEGKDIDTSWNSISFLDNSFDTRLGLPISIGPDYPSLRMSMWNGKWKNMVGHSFGLATVRYQNWQVSANISAFIELHDVTHGQFMSWQLWRGNLGTSLFIENKKMNSLLFKGSRIVLQTGWYHESQHATDGFSYASEYLNSTLFNNASLRSFEHYILQLHYTYTTPTDDWVFYCSAGYKYYPQPLLLSATRTLEHAYLFEAGVNKKLDNLFEIYIQGYFERQVNNFIDRSDALSIFKNNWNAEPFMTRQIEFGGQFTYRKKRVNLYWAFSNSNGRGLDFIKVFKEPGAGVRFNL